MDKPRSSRIGNPTKVLVALAGGVLAIMLGTMAIATGFWADNFQRVSDKIRRLTEAPSISAGSRDKRLDDKSTSPLAKGGLTPKETENEQTQGFEQQKAPTAKKGGDLGKGGKILTPLRGASEPQPIPASPLGSSGSGSIASAPLPDGFGRMEIEDESPKVQEKPSKPPQGKGDTPETTEEVKPSTQVSSKREDIGEPQATFSPHQFGEDTPSSPGPDVPSASKVVVQAGESLTRIVNRNYPENRKMGMAAVILANPTITSENQIYRGQILYLPEINIPKQTIRLGDNLLYAIYGTYMSAEDLKKDTTWLAKKEVHFVVREIKNSSGNVVYRVLLGGYANEEKLEEARRDVKTR